MIRVLRLLEYEYKTQEQADRDMGNWYIPANGSRRLGFNPGIEVIRSSVIIDLNPKEPESPAG